MGKKNNIIEINGKRYDARTGAALGHHAPAVHHASTAAQPALKAAPSHHASPAKPSHHDIIRQPAKKAASHRPQASATLMRHAVKKPAASRHSRVRAHGHTDSLVAKPGAQIDIKPPVYKLDAERLKKARRIRQNQLVSHFSSSSAAVAIPVAIGRRPVATGPDLAARPAPTAPPARERQPATTAELLDHALQHATSHEQNPPKIAKKRRSKPKRIASISALVAAFVVLGSVIAFQNMTTIYLHVASSKAGFAASLPSYKPAGYHLSHLNYDAGMVAAQYQSNSDGRKYAITEKTSDWDSASLRDNYLASLGENYQTVESAGRTVFLYGQNAATWVSGGVWYQVESNGALSPHQLVQLASSM